MKPIKRGMKEAVTRDGRKVTQLTWFEGLNSRAECAYGVVDGVLRSWLENGSYLSADKKHDLDLFAPPEYEWQWLFQYADGSFNTTVYYETEEAMLDFHNSGGRHNFKRIEESKREVKA